MFGPQHSTQWPEAVVSRVVVVSSADRNTSAYASAAEFSVPLSQRLYDVLGIKLVAADISGTTTPTPFVLHVNEFSRLVSSSSTMDGAFAYIMPTVNGPRISFVNQSQSMTDDAYTHLFSPATVSLDKMRIRLTDTSNALLNMTDKTVTLTFVVYMRFSKASRA